MNPMAYCQDQCLTPGTLLYYSFRSIEPETPQYQAALSLYTLHQAWCRIIYDCPEPTVAAQKFSWWATELERLAAGQAQHPACLALQTLSDAIDLDWTQLNAVLTGIQTNARYDGYKRSADGIQHAHRERYAFYQLIHQLFAQHQPVNTVFVHELAIGMSLLNLLSQLRQALTHGRLYLASEDCEAEGISADAMLQHPETIDWRGVGRRCVQRALTAFQQALTALAEKDFRTQHHLVSLMRLHSQWAWSLHETQYRLWREQVRLTPLRSWWLSRQTQRWIKREKNHRFGDELAAIIAALGAQHGAG